MKLKKNWTDRCHNHLLSMLQRHLPEANEDEHQPATLEDIYAEVLRHNQRMEERQTEMMQAIQKIQRDQHDYANWHDQGMAELSKEMSALTHHVDAIQEYTQHEGLDPT